MFSPTLWRFERSVDPFSEMLRLRNEMNRLFSGSSYAFEAAYPPVNVWMNEKGAIVEAELPGIDASKIDISVLEDTVTISGNRSDEVLKAEDSYHRKERNDNKFSRTLHLPFKIENKSIEARYDKGVLNIALPREAAEKPKKIAIKAG
ncbi:MAG: Spore protein SP21 [Syntrophus sp. SKADARSKE-3]|nr:Spore protein SP21 [Syntrophus sp. SKADARSKE-3]